MVEEKKAEASEVETPETPEAQAPSMDDLQTQMATLGKQLEEARREARSHQEYGRKTKQELDKRVELEQKVSGLGDRLDIATQMLADLIDRGAEEELETPPKKRKSEEYLGRLKDSETRRRESEAQKWSRLASEADGLLKSVGLEMDKSLEAKEAYIKFLRYEPEAGLEEVRRVVEQKKTEAKPEEPKESEEVRVERLAEEKARRKLEEKGLLKTETGEPSASSGSFQEFEREYVAGKRSYEEYAKRARQEGKI